MSINVRNGGVWRDSVPNVRNGGVWKPVKEGYVRNGGVWRKFYSSTPTWTVTPSSAATVSGVIDGVDTVWSMGTVTPSSPIDGISLTECNLSYTYPSESPSFSAAIRFSSGSIPLFDRTVRIAGQLITLNAFSSFYWSSTSPTGYASYPFLICGYNRSQHPNTYGKTYAPFTVELLP